MQNGTRAGANGPLPEDMNQYFQLNTIKETLEWVHTDLIKTTAKPTDPNYLNELLAHRYSRRSNVDLAEALSGIRAQKRRTSNRARPPICEDSSTFLGLPIRWLVHMISIGLAELLENNPIRKALANE